MLIGVGLGLAFVRTQQGGWSPGALGSDLAAWFRGDTYTESLGVVTAWTDRSGNGRHAPVGGIPPVAETRSGQPCMNFAGGASFLNVLDNLLTAGAAGTVYCVAEAADATGGAMYSDRSGVGTVNRIDGSLFITIAGTTYIYSDEISNTVAASSNLATEVQTQFYSEHSYAGAGLAPTLYLNGTSRSLGAGTQGTENGTTGFKIGTNSASQPWNGWIWELFVARRQLTAGERSAANASAVLRYGL